MLAPSEKPLNPRLLFTIGSEFLENTESIAIKGSIDYEDSHHRESGSFSLIMNHGDSLVFLIEGPFKVDVFRLIIAGQTAYAIDRESDEWIVAAADEKLEISDYGVDGITPDLVRYAVFPQFYLGHSLMYDHEKSAILTEDYIFRVISSNDQKSFSFLNPDLDLLAFYSHRSDFEGGYYPSRIEISPYDKRWEITLEIDKLRLNPKIPAQIWDRD